MPFQDSNLYEVMQLSMSDAFARAPADVAWKT